jgi:hypothetical protein
MATESFARLARILPGQSAVSFRAMAVANKRPEHIAFNRALQGVEPDPERSVTLAGRRHERFRRRRQFFQDTMSKQLRYGSRLRFCFLFRRVELQVRKPVGWARGMPLKSLPNVRPSSRARHVAAGDYSLRLPKTARLNPGESGCFAFGQRGVCCDQRLPQAQAAVARRNLGMSENFKAI